MIGCDELVLDELEPKCSFEFVHADLDLGAPFKAQMRDLDRLVTRHSIGLFAGRSRPERVDVFLRDLPGVSLHRWVFIRSCFQDNSRRHNHCGFHYLALKLSLSSIYCHAAPSLLLFLFLMFSKALSHF
jgi:hypothetical protein